MNREPREHDEHEQDVEHPSGVPDEDEMSNKKHVSGEDPDMQILEEDPA